MDNKNIPINLSSGDFNSFGLKSSINNSDVKADKNFQPKIMPKTILQVNNVKTSYGKFSISNISFTLKSGDILGLVGGSGSGKSTLIKTLVGLKLLEKGTIRTIVGNELMDLDEIVGYSPQENALFPFLTLEENLFTIANLHNIDKKILKKTMGPLLQRLDLFSSRYKKIIELSGGMQKRADLAATLIHAPKIIILDEPFSGLDISLQKFIWQILRELAMQGKIIIISSHLLSDIQKNCNQFGLVENGFFYSTIQIREAISKSKELSLELFFEKLFAKHIFSQ